MAQEPRRKKSPNQLSAEIARSRELVERDLRAVRAELDIPRKIRRSFRSQTGAWIAVAAVIGIALAVRATRRKKIYLEAKSEHKTKTRLLEAGFVLGALRIAATFLKPMVVKFVTQKMHDYADRSHSPKKW
jgi:hypothetical protein